MSRPKSGRPAYCLHKRTGRAFVTIDGRQKTLTGKFGSAESRAAYDRLAGTWLANGKALPPAAQASVARRPELSPPHARTRDRPLLRVREYDNLALLQAGRAP